MNAQKIIKILNEINPHGFSREVGMLPENKVLLDDIYSLARQIEPCDKYRNGIDRKLWLWTDRGSFEEFADTFKSHFTYTSVLKCLDREEDVTNYEEMKEQWPVYFPNDIVWFKLYLAEHDGNRGLFLDNRCIIDTGENLSDKKDMGPLLEWILDAEAKCITMIRQGIYSDFISGNLPHRHRSGVTSMGVYWKYVPEDKQRILGKINPDELVEFRAWNQYEDSGWTGMTSNDYFRICDCVYDLLDIKTKYPIYKKDAQEEPLTPKKFYMAYAANYGSAKPFLELNGDSAEEFSEFVEHGMTEHHTWEVCLVPNIHLYPRIINGKYYISVAFDNDEYDLFIHLALALRKKGFPILKPTHIEERISGEQLVEIVPDGDDFDWRYAESAGFRTTESRRLPKGNSAELIKEIRWFPTGKWFMTDE